MSNLPVIPRSVLDAYFEAGIVLVYWNALLLPREHAMRFQGTGVSVQDDPVLGQTAITITGGQTTTTTTANFTQPAILATVAIQVTSTASLAPGLRVFVAGGGYYNVTAVADATHATIQNDGTTGNAIAGATIVSGAIVIPSGPGGQLQIQGNDVSVTPRGILDFRGFLVSDDSGGGRTVVTNTVGSPITVGAGAHTMQPGETWALIHAGDVVTMPVAAIVGQTLEFTPVSGDFTSNPCSWVGNGHNLVDPQDPTNLSGTSPPAAIAFGKVNNVTYRFRFDGSIYRCVN
jgi:hypothetical protein